MWNLKCTVIPGIIGATVIVMKSLRKNLEAISGNHSIIIRKVLQCEAGVWAVGVTVGSTDVPGRKRVTRDVIIIIIIIIIIMLIIMYIDTMNVEHEMQFYTSNNWSLKHTGGCAHPPVRCRQHFSTDRHTSRQQTAIHLHPSCRIYPRQKQVCK
jgi:hypothetical protein